MIAKRKGSTLPWAASATPTRPRLTPMACAVNVVIPALPVRANMDLLFIFFLSVIEISPLEWLGKHLWQNGHEGEQGCRWLVEHQSGSPAADGERGKSQAPAGA